MLFLLYLFSLICTIYGWGNQEDGYLKDENIDLIMGPLQSVITHLPMDYNTQPVCSNNKDLEALPEHLGEVLDGLVLRKTNYKIKIPMNLPLTQKCQLLCTRDLTKSDKNVLKQRIKEFYDLVPFLDGLPALLLKSDDDEGLSNITESKLAVNVPIGLHYNELGQADAVFTTNNDDLSLSQETDTTNANGKLFSYQLS